ncbi:MAG: hypothetical protein HYW47_01895 [Deltaproteobacteria bacterium]|nr:hypothetical protein [Deltaproteobacteria bacterium]
MRGFLKPFAFIAFFLPFFSFSLWTGEWQGEAEMHSYTLPASKGILYVSYTQTGVQLVLNKAQYKTKYTQQEWGPETYEIRNGDLFDESKKIGEVSENHISIFREALTPQGKYYFETHVTKTGEHSVSYDENWFTQKKPVYSLKGVLEVVPSQKLP